MAQIILTIDDAKLEEFKTGFLAHNPIQEDNDGNPIMNFSDWIKKCIIGQLLREYKIGKQNLVEAEIVVDETMIT